MLYLLSGKVAFRITALQRGMQTMFTNLSAVTCCCVVTINPSEKSSSISSNAKPPYMKRVDLTWIGVHLLLAKSYPACVVLSICEFFASCVEACSLMWHWHLCQVNHTVWTRLTSVCQLLSVAPYRLTDTMMTAWSMKCSGSAGNRTVSKDGYAAADYRHIA
jgi:hypothetical protein